jgi:hypothetical protein
MRRLEVLRETLNRRYDFSVYATFRTVDRYNDGFINITNLGALTRYHRYYLSDRELL